MSKMATLTNNEEVAIVSGIFVIGLLATYVSAQTWIPETFRYTLAGMLGLIAFVGGTFWAVYVKADGNPANVPTPPQVPTLPATGVNSVPTATQTASSNAQAATSS